MALRNFAINENAPLDEAIKTLSIITTFYVQQGGQIPSSLEPVHKALSDSFLPHLVASYWGPAFKALDWLSKSEVKFRLSVLKVAGNANDHINMDVWVMGESRRLSVSIPVSDPQKRNGACRGKLYIDVNLRDHPQSQGLEIFAQSFSKSRNTTQSTVKCLIRGSFRVEPFR